MIQVNFHFSEDEEYVVCVITNHMNNMYVVHSIVNRASLEADNELFNDWKEAVHRHIVRRIKTQDPEVEIERFDDVTMDNIGAKPN